MLIVESVREHYDTMILNLKVVMTQNNFGIFEFSNAGNSNNRDRKV